ncbi:MATE family efflux transporter, partial [Vibrio cholerae]|uniref:MATE family efflux transporter n=1 Tax=Vibrio cholerae TaxID=666 RepID=UPI0039C927F9
GPVAELIFHFSDGSSEVKTYAEGYLFFRGWSAPAALLNFVLLGWLLGSQHARAPLRMVIISNLSNIVLDLVLVLGLG